MLFRFQGDRLLFPLPRLIFPAPAIHLQRLRETVVVRQNQQFTTVQLHAAEPDPLLTDAAPFSQRAACARVQVGERRPDRALTSLARRQQLVFLHPDQIRNVMGA